MSLNYLERYALKERERSHQGTLARIESALFYYLGVKNAFHQALLLALRGRGFYAFNLTFKRRAFYFWPSAGMSPARVQLAEALERRRIGLALDAFLDDALGHGGRPRLAGLPPLDIELRVTPEGGPRFVKALRAWLLGVRDALLRWDIPRLRVGFVLHAVKTDSPTWWDDLRVQMDGVRFLLDENPGLRRLIVGLDVAGVERTRPPRDCAPFFREARAFVASQDPGRYPYPWRPGFTFHVGEDFPDLLTGLRHVDEAAHLLGFRPNDRLGHALALGWDPDVFYDSADSPCVSLRERVMDLLWLLYLARESPGGLRDQTFWLRQSLMDILSKELPPQAVPDPGRLVDAAVDRTCAHFRGAPFRGEAELLEMLEIPRSHWEREEQIRCIDQEHRRGVRAAQTMVWRRVHEQGLFIEGNPTSNLFIGGFAAYSDLPMVLQGSAPGVSMIEALPTLRVTVNTDNPGIFDTTLRGEYVRIGRALLALCGRSTIGAAEISAWLDTVRKSGLTASFIPDDVPRGRKFVELLDEVIGSS